MSEFENKDFLRAHTILTMYFTTNGYFPSQDGTLEKRTLSDLLTEEEIRAIAPYIETTKLSVKSILDEIKNPKTPPKSPRK